MRDDVLALGIVVLIIGFVAYVYPQQATLLGYTYTVGYPYRDLGTALVILGIVALIVGAAMGKGGVMPIPERIHQSVATGPSKYCSSCGQMLRPTDVFCPRCGTHIWGAPTKV